MPYLLILRRNQDEPLGEAEAEVFQRFASWTRSLAESGILSAVERLMPATEGVTVSSRDGAVRFDGP